MPRVLGQGNDPLAPGRLPFAAVLITLVFGLFAARLFQLQIVESALLRERSERNSIRTIRLEAPRGEIVDRDGRVVATTRPAFGVQVIPNELRGGERTWEALGQLLEVDPARLSERFGTPRGSARFRPVTLDGDLTFDRLARVETHRHALAGVVTDVQPRRHYLEGDLAAHLLGTIGEIRAGQLDQEAFSGYRSGDVIGQTGIEARFESHLRGRAGGRNVMVDVAGREVDVLDEVQPLPGGRVVLALDLDLQRAAELAFLDVPEGAPEKMGAAVALDARTGDVLALVSRPAFDPNAFAGGIAADSWKALSSDEWDPLRNRAIQNHYPPASTYKAVMALALLEAGVIDRHSTAFCPGYFHHGRRTYRCWKRGGHGQVDLHAALQKSCDVFFYQYGVKLGVQRIADFGGRLLLGRPTGVDIGQEAPGLLPSPAWKEKRFGEPWYPGETVSISIGQGYNLMTPIQLAVTYAAIGNGGQVLRPRPVLRLETREGEVVGTFPPQIRASLEIAPPHLAAVRRALDAVVNQAGGTGGRARLPDLRVAGKTGTSQVVRRDLTEGLADHDVPIRHRDHAWFAAYAPADDAEIAVAVFVEHGEHGSSAAAPIARAVLEAWDAKRRAPAGEREGGAVAAARPTPGGGDGALD